jgi:CSLREA domain-containing protein
MPGRGIPAQLLTALALILFLASPAFSATINVSASASDVLNGANGQCSLREAIKPENYSENFLLLPGFGCGYLVAVVRSVRF